jgi:CDP-diacylglycerol---glycerol-3-phosphate 3-phosphatidyltransferase
MQNKTDPRHRLGNFLTGWMIPAMDRIHVSPNALTITGLVIIIAASVMVAFNYLLVGGLLILLSGLFDILDGAVARYSRKMTRFGGVMDSTFDRFSEGVLFLGLLVLYVPRGELLFPILIVLSLIFSFLISYIRARAEGAGINCEVGFFTRTERVLIMVVALIVAAFIPDWPILVALVILAVFSLVTVIQRLVHVYVQAKNKQASR